MTIEVTAATFEATIASGIVLLDFWASWCGPCRAFAPIYEGASAKHPDVVFGTIDTDAEPALAAAFEISAVPTLMAFRDGMLVFAKPGALAPTALDALIAKLRALDMRDVQRRLAASEQVAG